jgi:tetratricopeptide (TPR) repeat protein
MQAERDFLKSAIFSKIEEELRGRRIKLDVVDLRWGVDTTSIKQEDKREATVLKVCLEEIQQCKPFFIGLLGDRYGWVPNEERMKKIIDENDFRIEPKGKSVTALEIEFGVLASKEQLKHSFFYFRKPLPYEKFSPKKAAMFCDQYNPELTSEEKEDRKEALDKLKGDIRKHFDDSGTPGKVKEYTAKWDDKNGKVIGLEEWGDKVYIDILKDSKTYAEATWDDIPKTWEEQELALLDEFIVDHTQAFCGRTKLLAEIKQHLLSGSPEQWGVVVTGESGSGKSSVFSKIYSELKEEIENCFVLAHSAGISPRSKNVSNLLQIWIKQLWEFLEYKGNALEGFEKKDDPLTRITSPEKAEPKLKIDELQEKFTQLLFKAAEKTRVIILIDALDRFEPTSRAKYMSWLPNIMPGYVRLLCTAITGTEINAVSHNKGLTTKSIDYFSPEEAKDMLLTLCKLQHKNLPQKVVSAILAKEREYNLFASSSPLWLSFVVNIMMALDNDDFEKMRELEERGDAVIENYMEEMVNKFPSLPGELFLNLISKACGLFGEGFTNSVFNFIACSRNGLREKDLEKLLPRKTNIKWEPLQFAALRRWFRVHLVKQGEELQWNLAHSILRNSLKERITKDEYEKTNDLIASYLLENPADDTLRISETMYHLMEADNKKEAAEHYGSELIKEEVAGATKVLAEGIINDKDKQPNPSLEWVVEIFNFPDLAYKIRRKTGENFQFPLYAELQIEGNINERLILIQNILPFQKRFYDAEPGSYFPTYDLAVSYEKLGELFKTTGQSDKALNFFERVKILFEELYKANPKNEGLKEGLAISYRKLGELFQIMGQLDKALDFFEKNIKLAEELYKANPNNEGLKNGLVISYEKLGTLFEIMGQLDKALDFFEKCSKLCEELYKANPNNEGLKNGLAISYEKLGDLFKTIGQFDKALGFFEKYNQFNEELYKANPNNEGLKNGLAISYERLGDLFQTMGQLDKALGFFEKNKQFNEELFKANPNNEGLKNGLAISYERLGSLFQTMGQLDKALGLFEKVTILFEELYKANPNNEGLKNGLAISYERLGSLFQTMGQLDKALGLFEKVTILFEELYKANPNNEGLKEGLATSYERLGSLFQTMGQLDKALGLFEKVTFLSEELYKANPNNEVLKYNLAVSFEKHGDLFQTMGQLDKALGFFIKHNQINEKLYKANPRNIVLLEGLGISYYKLGVLYIATDKNIIGKEYLIKCREIYQRLFMTTHIPKYKQGLEQLKNDYGIE